MRPVAILIFLLSLFTSTYSQKKINQSAINDFAENAAWKYRYEDNGNFRAFINTYLLKGDFSLSDVAVLMENLKTDTQGRELVFKAICRVTGNSRDGIFNAIYAMGLKAQNAKEVSDYIYEKYVLGATVIENKTPPSQGSRTFLQVRYYHDQDTVWVYKVTIRGEGIKLESLAGKNNTHYKDKLKVINTYVGTLEADNSTIFINGDKDLFKIKSQNILCLKNNEGEWNEYFIFKE